MSKNLLDPIHIDNHAKAQRYARNHRCAECLGRLTLNMGIITCPEHGARMPHQVITSKTGDQVEQNILLGMREMSQPKKRSIEQTLYELGF